MVIETVTERLTHRWRRARSSGSQAPQRTGDGPGADGRADEQLITGSRPRSQPPDWGSVLVVSGVQERDHDACVERYPRHWSRKGSR
jgi:hypothetical protein